MYTSFPILALTAKCQSSLVLVLGIGRQQGTNIPSWEGERELTGSPSFLLKFPLNFLYVYNPDVLMWVLSIGWLGRLQQFSNSSCDCQMPELSGIGAEGREPTRSQPKWEGGRQYFAPLDISGNILFLTLAAKTWELSGIGAGGWEPTRSKQYLADLYVSGNI